MRREIRLEELGPPVSHYTDAVRFGDLLFISGIVATDGDGNVLGKGDPVAQARRIFENMGKILAAEGCGFGDVLKVTVFLRNMEHRVLINPVRQEVFGESRPASTLVEIAKLVDPEMLVEIEGMVAAPLDG